MTRGNQREIDRERARKRNAEKASENKKSDFFKNKDRYLWVYSATLISCARNRRSSRRNRATITRRSLKRRRNTRKTRTIADSRLLILHPIINQATCEYFIKKYKKHNLLIVCLLSKGPSDNCLGIVFKIYPKTWGGAARTDRIPFALLPDHFVWSRMMLL